jgi:hypothetical protein
MEETFARNRANMRQHTQQLVTNPTTRNVWRLLNLTNSWIS